MALQSSTAKINYTDMGSGPAVENRRWRHSKRLPYDLRGDELPGREQFPRALQAVHVRKAPGHKGPRSSGGPIALLNATESFSSALALVILQPPAYVAGIPESPIAFSDCDLSRLEELHASCRCRRRHGKPDMRALS